MEYIARNYSKALKIVEVGIGKFCEVAAEIKRRLPQTEVVVTDTRIEAIREVERKYPSLKAVQDDVTRPNLTVYTNANLIYSIRFPPELWPKLAELSELLNVDIILRPLSTETPVALPKFKLVNFGRTRFYMRMKKR